MDQAVTTARPSHPIILGLTHNGKHAVTTKVAPFFFFEAESEDEARAKAKRALDFYHSNRRNLVKRPESQYAVFGFYSQRPEDLELEAA